MTKIFAIANILVIAGMPVYRHAGTLAKWQKNAIES
jgi:hypothetical protein